MSFRHSKDDCFGIVLLEVSNLFRVFGKPVFIKGGKARITTIKIEDIFKLDESIKSVEMKFYCRNCQECIPIEEVVVECTHCYKHFPVNEIYILTGTGGYYCKKGTKLFEDDVTIEFERLSESTQIIQGKE